jgi:putative glycosyltransferase (TIGR04372 family)
MPILAFSTLAMKVRALIRRLIDAWLIFLVLLARMLRPFILVRFGPIRSDRMGHFTVNTELYLCECDANLHGRRFVDLFYCSSPTDNQSKVCNEQLLQMWKRVLHIHPVVRRLDEISRWLPGGAPHRVPWPKSEDRDIHGLLDRTPPHLSLTPEEEQQGRQWLRSVGVPDCAPFVCFLSRDPTYLVALYPHYDHSYHGYRDSRIESFFPALEELTRRGYFAFRMGAVVKEPLRVTVPGVIDYATRHRSEFLDIFLGARCRFYLGDTNGFGGIPMIFRRPVALVNFIPLEYARAAGSRDLFIPKKIWSRRDKNLLKFGDIHTSGVGRFAYNRQYEQSGLELIDNTPEEISALAREMDDRLNGRWRAEAEDENLQKRFWAFFKPSEINGVFQSRIGAEFLRQNRELLN